MDVCAGGTSGEDSSSMQAGNEYAAVKYQLDLNNEIASMTTLLKVPAEPKSQGTLFIWPGLQWFGGRDPASLGNGILQPVLTWGRSCAPGMPPSFDTWWISGMYVNVSTAAAGPTGCAGGDAMNAGVGDALRIDMALSDTTWKQTIVDAKTSKSVDFSIDLENQAQDWATLAVELPAGGMVKPTEDVIFTQTVLTFKSPVTSCQPSQRGPKDYFSPPQLSIDGLHCCISKVILRVQGVAATSPDSP